MELEREQASGLARSRCLGRAGGLHRLKDEGHRAKRPRAIFETDRGLPISRATAASAPACSAVIAHSSTWLNHRCSAGRTGGVAHSRDGDRAATGHQAKRPVPLRGRFHGPQRHRLVNAGPTRARLARSLALSTTQQTKRTSDRSGCQPGRFAQRAARLVVLW